MNEQQEQKDIKQLIKETALQALQSLRSTGMEIATAADILADITREEDDIYTLVEIVRTALLNEENSVIRLSLLRALRKVSSRLERRITSAAPK